MKGSIGIRPQARIDIVELATYIGKDNVTVANLFLDACDATFEFLLKSPQIGASYPTKNPRLVDLCAYRVQGFPNHLVFYLERQTGIEIVRVLHGARDLDAVFRDA